MMPARDPSRPVVRATRQSVVWLVVALGMVVIGWGKTINLFLLVGYLMFALGGVNGYLARRAVRGVACRRTPSPAVFAGGPMPVGVDVENVGRSTATIEVAAPGADRPTLWFVGDLGPGDIVPLRAEAVAPKRGRHHLLGVTAGCDYPFGLVRWEQTFGPGNELIVMPRMGRVDVRQFRRWLVRATGGEARRLRPSRRPLPGTGDVRGVRAYRDGDGIRDIHWKSSARRNQLVVREFDRVEADDLTLIVDRVVPPGDPTAFERLLELAASIGWAWTRADDPGGLTLVVPGELPIVRTPATDAASVRQAFEVLADLSPLPADRPGGNVPRSRTAATQLLVTARPGGGPLLAAIGSGGVWVGPDTAPRWYQPPAAAPDPTSAGDPISTAR